MDKRLLGVGATLVSAMYFGFMPLLMKTVYANGGNSFIGSFLRFAFAIPFLLIYLRVKKTDIRVTKEEFKQLLIITVFGFGGTSILLFSSYLFLPSGMATTIHFLYPTVTVVGMIVFLKEKIRPIKIVCVVLCLMGILFFNDSEGGVTAIGLILALLSSMTYGFYTIYLGHSKLKEMDSIKLLFHMTWMGAVMMGIIGLATGNLEFHLKPVAWGVACLVSVLTTFIGALGYQIGVKHIGSENTAMLSTFEPITSVIVGLLVYNEAFTLRTALGCISILTATIIIARMKE